MATAGSIQRLAAAASGLLTSAVLLHRPLDGGEAGPRAGLLPVARLDDSPAADPGPDSRTNPGIAGLGSILGVPRVHVPMPVTSATTGMAQREGGIAGREETQGGTPGPAAPASGASPAAGAAGGGGSWWGFGGGAKKAPAEDGAGGDLGAAAAARSGAPAAPPPRSEEQRPRNPNPNPRDTAAGFDPEALERGAKALREINKSPNAKQVFDVMRKQEETRQLEEKSRLAELQAYQAQHETERQRMMLDEQRKQIQEKAQTEAQLARYRDELARKRMQAEHEAQRVRNAELVKLQEESSLKQEQLRRATEEEIQMQLRQTELQRAEIERETLRQKAMAEAEARAHEARLSEDVNRRLMLERAGKETEKWVAAINTTFGHIGGGLRALLTDQNKLIVTVGGVTALAAGVYTTREGARVIWSYIDRILGQPSLVRESSRGPYPWSPMVRRMRQLITQPHASRAAAQAAASGPAGASTGAPTAAEAAAASQASSAVASALMRAGKGFGDVILGPSLHQRIRSLAAATANTRRHGAPFRNMLFYGPPGTGKTMAAKELARQSGLDYALMTGGDVAPLGPQAVTKIHQMFDWATKSQKGLLLFIDEADAFLAERNRTTMSEAQRSALNAMLFRTGDQSRDIVLVLATNRPGDLDSAVTDRIDEMLEFPLPGEEERFRLLQLYLYQYVTSPPKRHGPWWQSLFRPQEKIEVQGITDEVLREAASRLEGFSGREIAKLMASVRGAVYGGQATLLDAKLFREVVDYKVAEHGQRRELAAKAADQGHATPSADSKL